MNQSLWATIKIHTIKITIFKPTSLVRVCPKGFFTKWAIIRTIPVDTSDNAWYTDLNVGQATAIDDSLIDPGLHLPVITGITATWNEDRDEITVEWDESNDPKVVGYIIHLNPEFYEDVRSAYYQFDMVQGTRSTVTPMPLPIEETNNLAAFDVNGTWHISVVAYDGEVTRFGVTPVEVRNWTSDAQI